MLNLASVLVLGFSWPTLGPGQSDSRLSAAAGPDEVFYKMTMIGQFTCQ